MKCLLGVSESADKEFGRDDYTKRQGVAMVTAG